MNLIRFSKGGFLFLFFAVFIISSCSGPGEAPTWTEKEEKQLNSTKSEQSAQEKSSPKKKKEEPDRSAFKKIDPNKRNNPFKVKDPVKSRELKEADAEAANPLESYDPDKVKVMDAKEFAGKWKSYAIDVNIQSVKGIKDSTRKVRVGANKWEKVMGLKPIEWNFKPNGTYMHTYKSPSGRITRVFTGSWKIENENTLIMNERTPKPVKYTYRLGDMDKGIYSLRGLVDYDFDGAEDDKIVHLIKRD